MNDDEFEKLVESGVALIPERFMKKLTNVAIVIADTPTKSQRAENHIGSDDMLLGLYEGIPLSQRGEYYGTGMVLPDKITIFKKPICEEAALTGSTVESIVRDTVWHEIAHYFGYDEEAIHEREVRGTNNSA